MLLFDYLYLTICNKVTKSERFLQEAAMRSSTFDQIDQQILDLLIENSRISLIDISEQVGL